MRQIALDTETTGLSAQAGHRLTEIGCIEIIDRKVTGKKFHSYLNPERELDEGARRITGLTEEFLADKPLFSEVMNDFLKFIQGAQLIIHNAGFDLSFLNNELDLQASTYGRLEKEHTIIDTLLLARKLHPGQRNNLDALCKRYNIDNKQREKHGALLDAKLLIDVYLSMTAGQTSMDLSNSPTRNSQNDFGPAIDPLPIKRTGKIRIVKASESELNNHEDYLKFLDEKVSGKCIWREKQK